MEGPNMSQASPLGTTDVVINVENPAPLLQVGNQKANLDTMKGEVIEMKMIDELHKMVTEIISPLTETESPFDSIFVASESSVSDAQQKTLLNRVELDNYRQDIEARVQDFVRQAKAFELDLTALKMKCRMHPVLALQQEIPALRDEIEIKDRLIVTNGEKLRSWQQRLLTLKAKQKAVLLPEDK
eukprot:CFRG7303T1